MTKSRPEIAVRNTEPRDFDGIIELTREVYPDSPAWTLDHLASHLRVFPEGQFVAVNTDSQQVVGMAASLIILWDDYDITGNWRDFTDRGWFTNHNPRQGRTLYGAEVMVSPSLQGGGVGTKLYTARRNLVRRLGLLRIRAGARLPGYHLHADKMSVEDYVIRVVNDEFYDPTLSFQLRRGFHVLAIVPQYLHHDAKSWGFAALIEWLNPQVAKPEDYAARDPRFLKRK